MSAQLPLVSYQQVRHQIQSGDFLFCSGNYLLSHAIKRFSKSNFSHVGLLLSWNDRILLAESVEDDGVRFVPLSHYLTNYENSKKKYNGRLFIARHKIFTPKPEEKKINQLFGRAADLLNCNYDKGDIATIAARISLGIGRRSEDDAFICSEYVAECMKSIGVTFAVDSGGFIYPEHIAKDPSMKFLFELE